MPSAPDTNGSQLSLERLAEEVARELAARRIAGRAADGRVAPLPDARTIRYYTTLGLLDRPVIVEGRARYGDRHKLQLVTIKALQAAGLPLAEIQRRVYARSNAELESIVASLSASLATPAPAPLTPRGPAPARWLEIAVEPGIRLMVEESRLGAPLPDDLELRLRTAVDALRRQVPPPKEQQ